MALIDDLLIRFTAGDGGFLGRIHLIAALGTFYDVVDEYSLLQDLADEIGGTATQGFMAYPNPMSAETPTDFTMRNGWYRTQASYLRCKGGSIQTSGYDGVIYRLSIQSGGYTNAVAGDIGRIVTGGTSGATGYLIDYDNTARWWRIRRISGTFANSDVLTISGGTGAGTVAASSGVATGEDGHANAFTLGSVNHEGTYIVQNGAVLDDSNWYQGSNLTGNHIDVLIKIREGGTLIDSGICTFYNRVNRDAANALDGALTGDTYDWFQADLSGFGRTPVPLNTRSDPSDTLTNAQAANYLNGTTATISISTAGPYSVDVDQDGATETYEGRIDGDEVGNETLWSVVKYYFRKGATALVDGVEAQLFRTLNTGYTVVKDAPVGAIAGGRIEFARGWVLINPNTSDASDYQTTDNGGTVKVPPTFYVRQVSGLSSGMKVFLARRSSPGFALRNEFTLAAGNNSGNGTLVVSGAIPPDKPSTGYVRVIRNDGETEDRYAYTSWSGSTFTLSGTLSVSYGSGNSAYVPYIDETATGATISKSLRYVSDRDVVLQVRLGSGAGKIEPFVSNFTLGAADSSVPATTIADTINNN